MTDMLAELSNTPRPYPWGDFHSIATWQKRPAPRHPEAELWLGTHPGSEALVRHENRTESLSSWLADHGSSARLPYLVKLLAASQPLSIQVHPTKAQAQTGFDREEEAGIPIDAPHRNYRDQSDKPEILIAWSDQFLALVGFQTEQEAHKTLDSLLRLLGDTYVAEVRAALNLGIEGLVNWLFSGRDGVKSLAVALSEIWRPIERTINPSPLERVWDALIPLHPGDPGVVAASFMNLVELRRDQALFVPAGVVHAYLRGFGLEIMAPSDNVLRGGLTSKHIDRIELGSTVDVAPNSPHVLLNRKPDIPIHNYLVEGLPFLVTHCGAAATFVFEGSGPWIIVVESGAGSITSGALGTRIYEGKAYALAREKDSPSSVLESDGSIYVIQPSGSGPSL